LEPGQTVVIKGVETGDHFNVTFMTSPRYEDSNIPLQITIRAREKVAILNDRRGGKWGKEEKRKEPFREGEKVDLRIRVHDNRFEVFANQREIGEFEHRQPLISINHLYIDGTIDMHHVSWGGKYYAVPYQASVEGGFGPGKRLMVSGRPEKNGKQFSVNLLTAANEMAFHFNPRLNEKDVIRNSQLAGQWGNEEGKKEPVFPFERDSAFDIMIVNEPHSYQVFVNGAHYCAFAHRTDPNNIRALRIEGDVELQSVHVK
jgi:hypothetical protein